ncbi:MAG TPA: hypothetical protein VK186_21680 [Candidatus Deferrimicrobium sp.]|nr:hypothetical protein [Candidatus Deferrimicrobium sp.]
MKIHLQDNTLDLLHDELGVSAEWLLFENGPIFWKDIQAKISGNKEDGGEKIDLFRHYQFVILLEEFPGLCISSLPGCL